MECSGLPVHGQVLRVRACFLPKFLNKIRDIKKILPIYRETGAFQLGAVIIDDKENLIVNNVRNVLFTGAVDTMWVKPFRWT